MEPEARDALADSLQRFGLERGRMLAALARQAGITETDLAAIEHLEAAGPLTQRDLGARLALSSGAVTMLADRLERAGWVSRRPHPSDRRFVLLELSPQVAEQTPPALARYHAAIQALAAKVPAEHRDALDAFLGAAAQAAADAASQISTPALRRLGATLGGKPDTNPETRGVRSLIMALSLSACDDARIVWFGRLIHY